MNTTTETCPEITVAARVAGEDIVCGDFVTVTNEAIEFPSFLWSDSGVSLPAEEVVRIRYTASDAGEPHKVIGICLPFVYTRKPDGHIATIDTRLCQMVRLDKNCAKMIWKELTKSHSRKKRK